MSAPESTRPSVRPAGDLDQGERLHSWFMPALTSIVVLALWVRPMFSSLWLDELGTWWAVKDGLGDAIHRAIEFHGQSPLYYTVEWVTTTLGGRSEAVLRLPSFAALATAAFLLWRLTRRLVDEEAARYAVLAFAASGGVAFAASEARPYALATLSVVAATLALVAWLDDAGRGRAALYVVLAVSTVWVHYLFGLVLVSHLIYATTRVRREQTPVRPRHVVLAAAAIFVGATPLLAQAVSLWDRRGSLSIPAAPTMQGLIIVLVPPVIVGALFLGGLLARALGSVTLERRVSRPSALALLVPWLLIPPSVLFLVSAATPVILLSPRYFLSAAPAAAVLAGWVMSEIQPAVARGLIAATLAILAILASGSPLKDGEDWRGAAAFVRANTDSTTVVLLHPALVESAQLDWLSDPERRSYLLSPTSYYPMAGRVLPMPYVLDAGAEGYLEHLVDSELAGESRFLLVTRYPDVPFRAWLDGRLAQEGFTSRVVGSFGIIEVIEFRRE